MKKSIGLGIAGLLIAPFAAQAADLPSRVAPPVFVPPAPAFTWTGLYIGGNAGYGFDRTGSASGPTALSVRAAPVGTFAVTPANGVPFLSQSAGHRNGFVGGGQIGYNYQFGSGSGVVVGFEADFDYFGLNGGNQVGGLGLAVPGGNPRVAPDGTGRGVAALGVGGATSPGNVAFFNNVQRGPGDFLGTIRGRIGYAFDRVLVFGTGGFAYTSGRNDGTTGGFANGASVPANFYVGGAQAGGAAVNPTALSSGGNVGYVVGGGVEYAIPTDSVINVFHSSAVTLKVEGFYFDLGREGASGSQIVGVSNTGAVITGTGFTQRENTFAVVRAGINFKFGSLVEAAPVVARY